MGSTSGVGCASFFSFVPLRAWLQTMALGQQLKLTLTATHTHPKSVTDWGFRDFSFFIVVMGLSVKGGLIMECRPRTTGHPSILSWSSHFQPTSLNHPTTLARFSSSTSLFQGLKKYACKQRCRKTLPRVALENKVDQLPDVWCRSGRT